MNDSTIRFISQRSEYGWLSNYAPAQFVLLGHNWATSEHAFQAAKVNFLGPWTLRIYAAETPGEAKKLGQECPLRDRWGQVKVPTMRMILVAKFTQNTDLCRKLLATGARAIEEDAKWDSFWGTGKTGPGGNGRNMMGSLLMELRQELRLILQGVRREA
jgi:ribA/ribD-fused uncharacterized protein